MYHIQLVGAGYTGLAMARYFRGKKQKVWALTRTPKNHSELNVIGATPILADLTRPETLSAIPPAHFIVIGVAPHERTDAAYREVYIHGVANYLNAIRKNPAPNFIVYLSSTGVYGEKNGEWVDENTPPGPDSERGKILLEAEQQILNSGFPAVIFRLGGIYGPGRSMVRPETESRQRYKNRIHIEDIVGAMPVLFNKAKPGEIYLGVDDGPLNCPEKTSGKRCRNNKLKALGYSFKFPVFKEGYSQPL